MDFSKWKRLNVCTFMFELDKQFVMKIFNNLKDVYTTTIKDIFFFSL